MLSQFDNLIKKKCIENSVAWHKKKEMSMETVESLYTTMVKVSTDPETGDPTVNIHLNSVSRLLNETINGNVVSLMKPEPNWKIQIWNLY